MNKLVLILLLSVPMISVAAISPRTYNALNDLQEALSLAVDNKQYSEIESGIEELLNGLQGNALGQALALQLQAQLKDAQGEPKEALSSLKKAYALKGLDTTTKAQIGTSLAYMYFSQGDYSNAILILESYIKGLKKEPSGTILALTAMSYFGLDDYSTGLPYIEKACEISVKPNESWLANAFAANYKLNDLKRAIYYTNLLVLNFPEKPEYWLQKTGLHQSLEEYEKAALSSSLSNQQGYLTKESEFFNLGVLMASAGAPYEVAVTLERAIDLSLIESSEKVERLLMQAWVQSKEMPSAIKSLRAIYIKYNDPKDGVLLANYLMDAELWVDALSVTGKLIKDKEALTEKQLGTVLLMSGVSHFRNGSIQTALVDLGKASGLAEFSNQAKSWMNYIKQMQG